MSITVLNYMDHALVSRINEQAAKRAEAAKQSNTDDFAAALADSTKALENSQNTSQTGTTGSDTSGISAAQTTASSANSYTSGELDSIFEEAANTYGVSSIILKSIAKAESGFNPSAVSNAGAVGIMQLMPSTAAALVFPIPMMQEKISWAVQNISASYYPIIREISPLRSPLTMPAARMWTNTAASRLLPRHRITSKKYSLIWKNLVLLFQIPYLLFQISFLLFSI